MNILVLAEAYPEMSGAKPLAYVRTRNVFYKECGHAVTVLNFRSNSPYVMDGIQVYDKNSFEKECNISAYDLVLSHAPNLRHHLCFLSARMNEIRHLVFFYHGHEVLKINKVYPPPFPYLKRNRFKEKAQDLYDEFKFRVLRSFYQKHHEKISSIFVSHWMYDEFMKWVKVPERFIEGKSYITYNSVGAVFEKESYTPDSDKKYDYITIRAYLDGSKYAVDIVNNLALRNPYKNFLLVGRGRYFDYNNLSPNVTRISKELSHEEMLDLLNQSRCALMPTRTDAQGVMMCEMATYGIPLITSDIPVCHEVFDDFEGVGFISNERYIYQSLDEIYADIRGFHRKNPKYFNSLLGEKEISILGKINAAKI